jgi:hypothetical protein
MHAQVKVNGTVISERAIAGELQYHPAASLEEAWTRAATALVVRELLSRRAIELGIKQEGEEECIDALLAAEVHTPEADPETCRRWYDRNHGRFAGRAFDDVADAVASYLGDAAWVSACRQYVRLLVGRARIEGIDLSGAESPLLQ